MDANERRARMTQEAAQWWNRFGIDQQREVSRTDREQFTLWLRESPLHVAELLRIAQLHGELERFRQWDEIDAADPGEACNVIRLRESDDLSEASAEEIDDVAGQKRHSRGTIWAMVASICCVMLVAGWLALVSRGEVMGTGLAERRQVMLGDGSVVSLEPETTLRVRFEDRVRHIELERGRALFRVAKDVWRPFLVTTGDTTVRAVGTEFGVERAGGSVVITVAEGRVAVGHSAGDAPWISSSQDEAEPQRVQTGGGPVVDGEEQDAGFGSTAGTWESEIFLTAGEQVTVHNTGVADRVRTVDTVRALAWTRGQLVFENATLADVVSQFNRYNRTQLRISDSQLAARRVSGVLEATDTETLLAFIRQGRRDIRVTRENGGIVVGTNGQ
jgi:transmembrane sensor